MILSKMILLQEAIAGAFLLPFILLLIAGAVGVLIYFLFRIAKTYRKKTEGERKDLEFKRRVYIIVSIIIFAGLVLFIGWLNSITYS